MIRPVSRLGSGLLGMCKVVHGLPSAKGTGRPDLPGRGKDDVEQRFGVRGGVLATTIPQVVVGRGQREEPLAGVYYPVDEGLDFGQGLLVGLGDKPTAAKVPAQEVQPAGGQFAVQFPLKGADASPEGVYFTSYDADSSDGLFAGRAGNFRTADIFGHFRTSGEGAGVERDFEATVGSGQLIAEGLFTHESSRCLSGYIGWSTSNGRLSRTSNMVERCFPSWQGANVSGEESR